MNSNGRAIGGNNELASTISSDQQQYAELIDFQKETQNGVKNVFVYAPERVNIKQLLAGSPGVLGAYFGSAPDQFSYHNLTSTQSRRLGGIPTVTLDINYTVLTNYTTFSDTSTGNFTCNLYFTMGTIFDETYLQNSAFPVFSIRFNPFIVVKVGRFDWVKSTLTYSFTPYNQTLILNDTINSRNTQNIGGTVYADFTNNPTKMTEGQFQRYIIEGGVPLAFSYAFDSTGLAAGDAAFVAANFLANVSYSFGYYGLLSNF